MLALCSDPSWILGLCGTPGALQQEHAVSVGAAACQQQNCSSHGKSEESAVDVTGQLSRGKGFSCPGGCWPSRALGANRLCWECSAVDLERGAGRRDVLCLHQMESLGVFAPVPRQLQLLHCWVHRAQFLWGPCKVPELW